MYVTMQDSPNVSDADEYYLEKLENDMFSTPMSSPRVDAIRAPMLLQAPVFGVLQPGVGSMAMQQVDGFYTYSDTLQLTSEDETSDEDQKHLSQSVVVSIDLEPNLHNEFSATIFSVSPKAKEQNTKRSHCYLQLLPRHGRPGVLRWFRAR